jgi:transposase
LPRWWRSPPNTIWTWHRRWRKDGIGGLADRPKSGRKTKSNDAYVRELEVALATDPQQIGLAYHIWMLNKLRLYLHQPASACISLHQPASACISKPASC